MNLTASLFGSGLVHSVELDDAPNPKPSVADKAHFGQLASLYTAFSLEFASYALNFAISSGCTRIADPFGGTGTLGEAARALPIALRMGDISPFAALSGAFRSTPKDIIVASAEALQLFAKKSRAPDERRMYAELFETIEIQAKSKIANIIAAPSSPKHRKAAAIVYLAALSRIQLYKRFAGSNPTWIKRPNSTANSDATRKAIISTIEQAKEFAFHLPAIHPANRTTSVWASIDQQEVPSGSLDAILTSPPYANRTDYIRHYLPASELLLQAAGQDERLVRAGQIGTPLIREDMPDDPLPKRVSHILDEVRKHPSYASERYYYKGFLYYFTDMRRALLQMKRWLRRGGLLLIVVQDTYYKDVYVPTADLLSELAVSVGFSKVGRRDWKVLHHLSRLSPHSRKSMPNRTLSESVVVLSK